MKKGLYYTINIIYYYYWFSNFIFKHLYYNQPIVDLISCLQRQIADFKLHFVTIYVNNLFLLFIVFCMNTMNLNNNDQSIW